MSKKLSKYISFFDYFDKYLIVSSLTSGGVSIAPFATVTGAPIRITSASLSLAFLLCTRLVKKSLKVKQVKQIKQYSKISKALINNQINHEEFITIINEETNYRELKESITMMKGPEDKI